VSMYVLDGFPLYDPRNGWGMITGTLPGVMAGRADNGVGYPGRDGVSPSLGSRFGAASVPISMKIQGRDREQTVKRLERLYRLLGTRHRLMELRHRLDYGRDPNGPSRIADVEMLGEPSITWLADTYAQATFVLSIPAGSWRSESPATAAVPFDRESVIFPEATATMQNVIVRITGPVDNPRVFDTATGKVIGLEGRVTDTVVLNAAKWEGRRHSSPSWDLDSGAAVPGPQILSNSGSGAAFVLTPDPVAGGVQLAAFGENVGPGAMLEVRSHLAYH